MKTFLLLVCALVLVISASTFGNIVYSGSQNVILTLGGSPSPAPAMRIISIAGDPGVWDDFVITLDYLTDPMGMIMGTTLGIGPMATTMGMSIGIGQVVGMFDAMMMPLVFNLARDTLISVDSPMIQSGLLLESNGSSLGQFGASGGYIGLAMPGSTYYAWLHMSSMSDIGGPTHSVTFDGWAYETESDVPIRAGDVPEPTILLLCGAGGLAAWLRRRRAS